MDRLLYCWCKTETPTLRRGGLTWPTVSEISVSVGSEARQQRDVAEEGCSVQGSQEAERGRAPEEGTREQTVPKPQP